MPPREISAAGWRRPGARGTRAFGVARPDPGAAPPGVVVLLGRAVGGAPSAVAHRVVTGGWAGTDLEAPLGRIGTPEDVARVVVFLLGPLSGWITGQTILADAGASLSV
jgi:NAD(P)-dependent dehydrogenase (short-subunit alcohol dehydrogenase family)